MEPSILSLEPPNVVKIHEFPAARTRLNTTNCLKPVYKEDVGANVAEIFTASHIRCVAGVSPGVKNTVSKLEVASVVCHVFAQGVANQGKAHQHLELSTPTLKGYEQRIIDHLKIAGDTIPSCNQN